ncbi:MAG: TPM domain-containing protein [Minisyncoccia bacterium]
MKYAIRAFGIVFALMLGGPLATAQNTPPRPPSHVIDLAGILSSGDAQALRDKLELLESRTTAQVILVIVKSLERDSLFDFTHKTARKWKLGTAEKHNGVLIVHVVAPGATRIHVGKGLEGDLPDAEAERILDNLMVPHLKQKEYAQAFNAGVDRIIAIVSGLETAPERSAERQSSERAIAAFFVFFIAFILLAIANAYGRSWGGSVGISSFAGAAWLIALTNPAIFIAAMIGLILGIFLRDVFKSDIPWCPTGCGDMAGGVARGAGEFLGAGAEALSG